MSNPFKPGDLAEHIEGDLDPRPVHSVEGEFIRLSIGDLVTGPLPAANYRRIPRPEPTEIPAGMERLLQAVDDLRAEWEVYLCDEYGFVLDPEGGPEVLLAMIDDPDAIDAEYGDMIPDSITVCRGESKPKPQFSTDTGPLRQPGSRRLIDFIDFDLEGEEDPERGLLLWRAAQGIADALNAPKEPTDG